MYQRDTNCFCNYTITLGLLERPKDMKITSVVLLLEERWVTLSLAGAWAFLKTQKEEFWRGRRMRIDSLKFMINR